MFEVGCRFAVTRDDGPAVLQLADLFGAHIDHRFNGQDNARFQQFAVTGHAIVRHFRIFMHIRADAVADVVADDALSEGFGIRLDCVADVAEVISGYGLFDALIKAFFGDLQELEGRRTNVTDRNRYRRIAMVAILVYY